MKCSATTYKGHLGPGLPCIPERHNEPFSEFLMLASVSKSNQGKWTHWIAKAKILKMGSGQRVWEPEGSRSSEDCNGS
jgi:hypothetical protein